MQFRTEVTIAPLPFSIGYRDKMLTIGSCFATHMGERLAQLKFSATHNPFGIVYNPISVCRALELMLGKREFTAHDLGFANGLWYSFYHHSSFSLSDKEQMLQQLNKEVERSAMLLESLDVLIITLGTAMVYEHKQTGQVVSNCHKLPSSQFNHRMLSVDEIYKQLATTIAMLKQLRPSLRFILSVSPIRHVKDDFTTNQLSKSSLLLAVDSVCKTHADVAYFPAYEIMMDELRDYRFYADDMLHPSPLAIEYIWQKFISAAADDEALAIIPEVERLVAAKRHRPFDPQTSEHKTFLSAFLQKTESLKERYPFLNLDKELDYFAAK